MAKPLILAVDSDGCALDVMEIKHRRCFAPATVEVWELEALKEAAFLCCLEINLYSRGRGLNRFLALQKLFQRLKNAFGAVHRLPDAGALDCWIEKGGPLSEEGLLRYLAEASVEDKKVLETCLRWTRRINELVAALPVPEPFEGALDALEAASAFADIHVVSSANHDTLLREWKEAGLLPYVHAFHGQEEGSKGQILTALKESCSVKHSLLMLGDAWADLEAADVAEALFFPIQPASELTSWKEFREVILPAFADRTLSPELLQNPRSRFAEVLQPLVD